MSITDVIVPVASVVFSGVVVAAVLTFIMERRQKKAQGMVATRTVDLEVHAVALNNEHNAYRNLAQRIDLIDAAHQQERESMARTIRNLREDLTEATTRITHLESEQERTSEKLMNVSRNHRIAIAYIKVLLAYINEAFPNHNAPPVPTELETDFRS